MSKDKISDYSTTANSNTDIGGINVDEGCAPSGINDAIRTLMAQLKTWQSGGQDVYIHPAGTASAPSITANGDTNTGIFFPAADTVGITTGGTERARVDSSGNLGLGVTPSAWSASFKAIQLGTKGAFYGSTSATVIADNVYNDGSAKYLTTAAAGNYVQSGGTHYWQIAGSGTAGNAITFTQAMTLDASGTLTVNRSGQGIVGTFGGGTQAAYIYTGNGVAYFAAETSVLNALAVEGSNNTVKLFTNGSERARIDSSGNLLVGTTTASGKFSLEYNGGSVVGQNINDSANTNNSTFMQFAIQGTQVGTIKRVGTTSAVVYNTTSDLKLKENIADAQPVLEKITAIKVRQFDWKEGNLHQDYGFIAQELNEVVSGVVTPAETEQDIWQLDYSRLTPHLVKAIQEQQAMIASQSAIITQLQADVAALKG